MNPYMLGLLGMAGGIYLGPVTTPTWRGVQPRTLPRFHTLPQHRAWNAEVDARKREKHKHRLARKGLL